MLKVEANVPDAETRLFPSLSLNFNRIFAVECEIPGKSEEESENTSEATARHTSLTCQAMYLLMLLHSIHSLISN